MAFPTVHVYGAFADDPLTNAPTLTDIGADATQFDTDRGRNFELDYVLTGKSHVTLKNTNRHYDPLFAAGPYFGALTANRHFRIAATYAGHTYPLWGGFADNYQLTTDDLSNRWAQTDLELSGPFKWLAPNKLEPITPWILEDPVYGLVGTAIVAGQLIFPVDPEHSGDRIGTILDLFPFPASMRDVDTGITYLLRDGTPDTGGALDPNDTALSYCQMIQDSEGGRFHEGPNGEAVFWARDHWTYTVSQFYPQATFADTPGANGYTAIVVDPEDDRYVRNQIIRTRRDWASPIVAISPGSTATYGPLPDERRIISHYSADVIAQVRWILAKYRGASERVSQLTINPLANPSVLFPLVLGLDIGDKITVSRKPAGVGPPIVADYWIERIQHKVSAQQTWETVWQLAPADTVAPWLVAAEAPTALLGSATPARVNDAVFPIPMPGAPPGSPYTFA